jgi:hypothetical protein
MGLCVEKEKNRQIRLGGGKMRAKSRFIPVDPRLDRSGELRRTKKNTANNPVNYIMKLNKSMKTILPLAAFAGPLTVPSVVSGATILATDFNTGTVANSTTKVMENISWTTTGITAPASSLTLVNNGVVNLDLGTGDLLNNAEAVGLFAPDNNTGKGGEWNTTISFATLTADIVLGDLDIDWINFSGNASPQSVNRDNVFNIQILDADNGGASLYNVSQTTPEVNTSASSPTETFDLSAVTLSGSTNYQLVISALDADNSGNHTAIDAFTLDGTVQSIPEPSSTLLLGLGSMALFIRRKRA